MTKTEHIAALIRTTVLPAKRAGTPLDLKELANSWHSNGFGVGVLFAVLVHLRFFWDGKMAYPQAPYLFEEVSIARVAAQAEHMRGWLAKVTPAAH